MGEVKALSTCSGAGRTTLDTHKKNLDKNLSGNGLKPL
jgi:hypothetical protein